VNEDSNSNRASESESSQDQNSQSPDPVTLPSASNAAGENPMRQSRMLSDLSKNSKKSKAANAAASDYLKAANSAASQSQPSKKSKAANSSKHGAFSFHATQACCSAASRGRDPFIDIIQQAADKYKEKHSDNDNCMLAKQIDDLIKSKKTLTEVTYRKDLAPLNSHSIEDEHGNSADSENLVLAGNDESKPEAKLFVKTASNDSGKRVWDKKHSCLN